MLTKEQQIFKNIKSRGVIKSHGKWVIDYKKLYCAIVDAGYKDYDTVRKIIDNMVAKGYIRKSHTGNRISSNYIIEKWVN